MNMALAPVLALFLWQNWVAATEELRIICFLLPLKRHKTQIMTNDFTTKNIRQPIVATSNFSRYVIQKNTFTLI